MPRHYIKPDLLPFRWGYRAIALCPLGIYYRSEEARENPATRNHEIIHWEQQKELLCLWFYLWYGIEYLVRLIRFMNHKKAYQGISFEREAKTYEQNSGYLSARKPFHWIWFVWT